MRGLVRDMTGMSLNAELSCLPNGKGQRVCDEAADESVTVRIGEQRLHDFSTVAPCTTLQSTRPAILQIHTPFPFDR